MHPLTTLSHHLFTRRAYVIGLVGVIALLGCGLRLYVAQTIPEDYDEDNYLGAARTFREAIDDGDWGAIPQVTNNKEHPPLVKILYSLTIDGDELEQIPEGPFKRGSKEDLPPNSLGRARAQSALAGGLTILAIGSTNPLAALLLSGQSLHVRFSSLAYLDALPTLFAALCAYFYGLSLRNGRRRWHYLALSAACLGIAVAAKYPFGIVGVALLCHALVYRRFTLKFLLGWGLLALLVFYCFNPYIWTSPFERTWQQLRFHEEYAEDQVDGRSLWRPFQQLTTHGNAMPDEVGSPLWYINDMILFILALGGVPLLLHQRSFYGWWLVIGMIFLMVWPTQWIQHKMMVMVPYSVSGAAALEWIWRQVLIIHRRLRQPTSSPLEAGS